MRSTVVVARSKVVRPAVVRLIVAMPGMVGTAGTDLIAGLLHATRRVHSPRRGSATAGAATVAIRSAASTAAIATIVNRRREPFLLLDFSIIIDPSCPNAVEVTRSSGSAGKMSCAPVPIRNPKPFSWPGSRQVLGPAGRGSFRPGVLGNLDEGFLHGYDCRKVNLRHAMSPATCPRILSEFSESTKLLSTSYVSNSRYRVRTSSRCLSNLRWRRCRAKPPRRQDPIRARRSHDLVSVLTIITWRDWLS